jgi:GNAT superfamily N-acetyltransferase
VDAMNVTVRAAQSSDINRIFGAYETWGYRGGIQPEDTAWLAEAADELIGVVRIAPENGTLVLRGMRIAEQWRRRGIGSQMLRVLAAWLGNRECYCVPYAHLVDFYGQIAFTEIAPDAAPRFLAERLAEYRRRALNVTIMVRLSSTI